MNLQPARVCCNTTAQIRGATLIQFPNMSFVGIIAVDAVMAIAAGNGVVKEDIAAKLEVRGAYLPEQ